MPSPFTTPFSQPQFQGWASFYGGNVQAPQAPPPSAFGAAALGQPPSNGQYTGGWAFPDAWANFYEGAQGFTAPQNQNSPAGALAATNYANNTQNPNDPNLLGWEQAFGNPQAMLSQDQNWAQSLGSAPTNAPPTGGWENPEAWAAYYGGTNGFTAPANAGSPASALAAASQISQTSNPQNNPALLGWVTDYGQPGSVLANTPNWAASLGNPAVNSQGTDIGQTNTQGWSSPLAWAAYYGGLQGFSQPVDNTLQAAQNFAGVTNQNDPSLLGWMLDYGNPQTVVSSVEASPAYQQFLAAQTQQQAEQQYLTEFEGNPNQYFYPYLQTALGGTNPDLTAAWTQFYGDPNTVNSWLQLDLSEVGTTVPYAGGFNQGGAVQQYLNAGTNVPYTTAYESLYGPPSVWASEGGASASLPNIPANLETYKGLGEAGVIADVNSQNSAANAFNAANPGGGYVAAPITFDANGNPVAEDLVTFDGESVFAPPGSVVTFYGYPSGGGASVNAYGELNLGNGVGVNSSGELTSVAGVSVPSQQITNTAPDYLQALLAGEKSVESPIGPVTVGGTPLFSGAGPAGSGLNPVELAAASAGIPLTSIQDLERAYASISPPGLNDYLNAQRAIAFHNAQNQAIRAITPEYFNAGAVQGSEFSPGIGSPSNTGIYGFLENEFPAQAGALAGPLISNLSDYQINQALSNGVNYLINGAGIPGGFASYSGSAGTVPEALNTAKWVSDAFTDLGTAQYVAGDSFDALAALLEESSQGLVPNLSPIPYSPPIGSYGVPDTGSGSDYNPNVDDYGRPIPDVGPPSPVFDYNSIIQSIGSTLGNLTSSWLPEATADNVSGVNPNVTVDQVATPAAAEGLLQNFPDISLPSNPQATDIAVTGGGQAPQQPVTIGNLALQSGLTGNVFPGEAQGFPDFAPQIPFDQSAEPIPYLQDFGQAALPAEVSGIPATPQNVFTDPAFGADSLYQGGYGEPVLEGEPPSVYPTAPGGEKVQSAADLLAKTQGMTLAQLGRTFGLPAMDARTPQGVQNYQIDFNNLSKAAADIWQMLPTGASLAGYSEAGILQMLQSTYAKILSQAGTDRASVQTAAANIKQDTQQDVEEGNAAYAPLPPPSYTTVPVYGTPQTPNYNPDNIRPPADIPNVTTPPASYDLGAAYGLPTPLAPFAAGYNYPAGSFGEVPYPDLLPQVEPPIQAGYSYIPGLFGDNPNPYMLGSIEYDAGFGNIPKVDYSHTDPGELLPSPRNTEAVQPNEYPNTNWSNFNPTPSSNIEDIRPPGDIWQPPIQAGYSYIPGLFGDNPDPYGNTQPAVTPPASYDLGAAYGPLDTQYGQPTSEAEATGVQVPTLPTQGDQGVPVLPGDVFQGGPLAGAPGDDLSYTSGPLGEAWPGSGPAPNDPTSWSPQEIAARAAQISAKGPVSEIDASGGFNYYQNQGLRPSQVPTETVQTPYGPITVSSAAAEDFGNFFQTLSDAGFPTGDPSGSLSVRQKYGYGGGAVTDSTPLSHISEHAWGAAVDVNNSTALTNAQINWIAANPDVFQDALQDNNISWGHAINLKFGPDNPHMEWNGPSPPIPSQTAPDYFDQQGGGGGMIGPVFQQALGAIANYAPQALGAIENYFYPPQPTFDQVAASSVPLAPQFEQPVFSYPDLGQTVGEDLAPQAPSLPDYGGLPLSDPWAQAYGSPANLAAAADIPWGFGGGDTTSTYQSPYSITGLAGPNAFAAIQRSPLSWLTNPQSEAEQIGLQRLQEVMNVEVPNSPAYPTSTGQAFVEQLLNRYFASGGTGNPDQFYTYLTNLYQYQTAMGTHQDDQGLGGAFSQGYYPRQASPGNPGVGPMNPATEMGSAYDNPVANPVDTAAYNAEMAAVILQGLNTTNWATGHGVGGGAPPINPVHIGTEIFGGESIPYLTQWAAAQRAGAPVFQPSANSFPSLPMLGF